MTRPYTPRAYQTTISHFILDTPRCMVWAGMGLGKTVATLTAINDLLLLEGGPVLVLAPKRVAISVWPTEVLKWEHTQHLRVAVITGSAAERSAALAQPADIHCTNYEQIEWLVKYWGGRWPYAVMVADEVTKLKSFRLKQGGIRAQALAEFAHTKVKRFIGLTGTPCPNGLQDLWGGCWFLDRGARLGRSHTAFIQRWFRLKHNGYGYEPFGHSNREIQDQLRDVCLTVEAKDYFDLREPVVNTIYVDLPPKTRKLYKQMEDDLFMDIGDNGIEAFGAAAKTIKLLQLTAGAVYLEGSNTQWEVLHDAKLDALEDVIEEAAGMPVLVAYQFKSDLARLKARFKTAVALDSRAETINRWNAGEIPVLLAHPASAGHGLSLQDGSNIVVFFAVDWNLENHLQIIERIGPVRQLQAGHNRNVFIHRIIARNTVDEMVLERLDNKREIQDILLTAMNRRANGRTEQTS